MKMTRVWAMRSKDTFSCKPIGNFVRRWTNNREVVVDPFSRNSTIGTVRNDLNPEVNSDYHLYADEFLLVLINKGVRADAIIFDPPYSLEQLKRSYDSIGIKYTQEDGWKPGRWTKEKDMADKLLQKGGIFLNFGWNSYGMGKGRGYTIEEIMLVSHGPGAYDTICMAEVKR